MFVGVIHELEQGDKLLLSMSLAGSILFFLVRWLLMIPMISIGLWGMRMLKSCTPDLSLVPATRIQHRRFRVIFSVVLFFAAVPAPWIRWPAIGALG